MELGGRSSRPFATWSCLGDWTMRHRSVVLGAAAVMVVVVVVVVVVAGNYGTTRLVTLAAWEATTRAAGWKL